MITKLYLKVNAQKNKKDREKQSFLVKYTIKYFLLIFYKFLNGVA